MEGLIQPWGTGVSGIHQKAQCSPGASCTKVAYAQKHGVRKKTWRSTLTFRCMKREITVELCGAPRQLHGWRTHVSTAIVTLVTLAESTPFALVVSVVYHRDRVIILQPRTGLWEPRSFHTDVGGYLLRQYQTSRGVTNRRYITSWDENGLPQLHRKRALLLLQPCWIRTNKLQASVCRIVRVIVFPSRLVLWLDITFSQIIARETGHSHQTVWQIEISSVQGSMGIPRLAECGKLHLFLSNFSGGGPPDPLSKYFPPTFKKLMTPFVVRHTRLTRGMTVRLLSFG